MTTALLFVPRLFLIVALATMPLFATASAQTLSSSDSALVGRILLAEDRRDSADVALTEGVRHSDERVQVIARRARWRILDRTFRARDSLPAPESPISWPEPAWRLRYRALAAQRADCRLIRVALADSAWPVRLHAADVVTSTCASDRSIAETLRRWIDALPANAARRTSGNVSWHAAAHAIVALARLRPAEARPRVARLSRHRQWQARMYSARAAAILSDVPRLRELARDPDDNVREAAIDALSKLTGHVDDPLYLRTLSASGAQAVRAAAVALTSSPLTSVHAAASNAFDRWVKRGNASARDTRLALLAAAGRPTTDDRPPAPSHDLPADVVSLALGADVRLRVVMTPASGGGAFVVRLRGDVAPLMAARVLALARAGYYVGTDWHRVEPDFVIQGGSPGSNEYVGLAHFLRDELGRVPHVRGTVGMSTRGHDTGDAQWFVNLRDNLRLGSDYTVFGDVVSGIEVVDGILEGDVIARIEPAVP